jgi:glutamine synthetase
VLDLGELTDALLCVTGTIFKFKLMRGTANPCIALCAILVGGIYSLENKPPAAAGDCRGEVANLSAEEQRGLQITTKPHTGIDDSLKKLQSDVALV